MAVSDIIPVRYKAVKTGNFASFFALLSLDSGADTRTAPLTQTLDQLLSN